MNKIDPTENKLPHKLFINACDILEKKVAPPWECHIHSKYTDGKASISEIFDVSIRKKLEIIIFTEHTEPWRFEDTSWYQRYYQEIDKFRKIHSDSVQAFIGIESSAVTFDGGLDATDEMLNTAEFILGAVHRYPEIVNQRVQDLKSNTAIDLEYQTLVGLSMNQNVDAVAHIGATCSKYCTSFPLHLVREVIARATKHKIAVEINPVYNRPLLPFLEICAEEGARVTLGSNAHGFGDIGLVSRELNKLF